jgi:uroporphyrin-III C-methyltransferase
MQADRLPQPTDATSSRLLEALAQLRGAGLPSFDPGEVWLVGAGPGDPGLLVLDAIAALLQADVVVYDALVDPRVLKLVRHGAEKVFAGKRGGQKSTSQEVIMQLLISSAARGLRVLRLKGGDPFLFGRGGEEMLALAAAGIPYRVVPGITSGLAALERASIPATMRGLNQAIVLAAGHAGGEPEASNWLQFARLGAPIVFYMASRNLRSITASLMGGGIAETTPAAIIASATLPTERVIVSTLKNLADEAAAAALEGPAIVVVGEIVRVRSDVLSLAATLKRHPPADCTRDAHA